MTTTTNDNWPKLLKRLKLDHIKRTAPGFFELSGGFAMKVKPYQDRTANGLTACIIDFITHLGGYANRINCTGIPRMSNGELKWTSSGSNKGTPDIRFLFQGRSGDIEVKIGADRLSPAQEKELEKITQAGGLVFIAKDFPSFLTWWKENGFPVPNYAGNGKQIDELRWLSESLGQKPTSIPGGVTTRLFFQAFLFLVTNPTDFFYSRAPFQKVLRIRDHFELSQIILAAYNGTHDDLSDDQKEKLLEVFQFLDYMYAHGRLDELKPYSLKLPKALING
jgi:hypothetical protein